MVYKHILLCKIVLGAKPHQVYELLCANKAHQQPTSLVKQQENSRFLFDNFLKIKLHIPYTEFIIEHPHRRVNILLKVKRCLTFNKVHC